MIFESFRLLIWLLKKDKYICPRCNFFVFRNETGCINCGQPLIPIK